ncbi:DUF3124 domain-containing protein [Carboxylicivirga taeanensis]|uniref:DUF3124 domain-containing protein n=1 Tax=Carboxylicivirga taeanensis TaxID=1416875 RepID=UPI003F6DA730
MRNLLILFIALLSFSCQHPAKKDTIKIVDWANRKSAPADFNGYAQGQSYLPVYSHIYHIHEHRTVDLAVTISIRNISQSDTVHILKADYFNTQGDHIRQYLKHPVFLKPMETIEIIIKEQDNEGGSGANFVFDWAAKNSNIPPLFEAVMISTYGQQGLSFITRGVKLDK